MSATTGDLHADITKVKIIKTAMSDQRLPMCGIRVNATAQIGRPMKIYGIRRPKRVRVLSLKLPNRG